MVRVMTVEVCWILCRELRRNVKRDWLLDKLIDKDTLLHQAQFPASPTFVK